MKTLFFDQTLRYLGDYPKPQPAAGEALIKVITAGICNTDIEITRGYKNFRGILGHEFVGRVEEINHKDQRLLGKRVVGDINCGCQKSSCDFCSRGLQRHCPDRTTLGIYGRNGCLAEYITLPIDNLFQVPEEVSNHQAVFAEPLAAAFEIPAQVHIRPGRKVLIVGDGKLGLLINHALSTTGADITHAGRHWEKLKLIQYNGCRTTLSHQLSDEQFEMVIEATGSKSGFDFSVAHTRPRGILVLKSTLADEHAIDLNPIVVNEITIVGSRCGLFGPALAYLAKGVDFLPLISDVFTIDKGLEAFKAAGRKGTLKVVIDF